MGFLYKIYTKNLRFGCDMVGKENGISVAENCWGAILFCRGFRIEEKYRLRQKYSICLLEEVVMLGCLAYKVQFAGQCSVSQ